MLNKLYVSNQELLKIMHWFEHNSSISSTPLTSPTIPPAGHIHRANVQQSIPGRLTAMPTESHGIITDHNRPFTVTNEIRDAIAPKVDAKSIASISIAISQLLANYEQQTK